MSRGKKASPNTNMVSGIGIFEDSWVKIVHYSSPNCRSNIQSLPAEAQRPRDKSKGFRIALEIVNMLKTGFLKQVSSLKLKHEYA